MEFVALSAALLQEGAAREAPAARPVPMPLRGGSYTLMVLPLAELARPDFFGRLRAKVMQAPSFFDGAPMLLDLEGTSGGAAADFVELGQRLRALRLVLVGVQGGDEAQQGAAAEAGLAIFPSWRAGRRGLREIEPLERAAPAPDPEPDPDPEPLRPLLVERPVRSGTRLYAEGRDLVVVAPVGAGAELLADGSIHVYGPLRGRALAGVSGDTTARIFCRRLEAELVSIAGRHRVAEEIAEPLLGRPAQVSLRGETLRIETMD